MSTAKKKNYYKRNPVQEAVFEIRFASSHWDSASAGQIYEILKSKFPVKKDAPPLLLNLGLQDPISAPLPLSAPVMQAWTADETFLLQFGPRIATANSLLYESWETFTDNVELLVEAFLEVTNPKNLTRVGVRFINRFEFSEDILDISDYLNFAIILPPHLQQVSKLEFVVESLYSLEDHGYLTKSKISTQLEEERTVIILDLECFRDFSEQPNGERLLVYGNNCHNIVEVIFESFLRDKMRDQLGVYKK